MSHYRSSYVSHTSTGLNTTLARGSAS